MAYELTEEDIELGIAIRHVTCQTEGCSNYLITYTMPCMPTIRCLDCNQMVLSVIDA